MRKRGFISDMTVLSQMGTHVEGQLSKCPARCAKCNKKHKTAALINMNCYIQTFNNLDIMANGTRHCALL